MPCRQGVGRTMLTACEALALAVGLDEVFLHARLEDDAALRLYSGYGVR